MEISLAQIYGHGCGRCGISMGSILGLADNNMCGFEWLFDEVESKTMALTEKWY
jgi:hypothetical protein